MSDKNKKDSYAQDTMQFTAPKQPPHKNTPTNSNAYGHGSAVKNPPPAQGQYSNYGYQQGNDAYYQQGQRPMGNMHQGQQYYNGNYNKSNSPQNNMSPQQSSPNHYPPQRQGNGQRQQQRQGQQQKQSQKRPKQNNGGRNMNTYDTPVKQKKKGIGSLLTKIFFGLLILLFVIFLIYSILAMIVISKFGHEETGARTAASHDLYQSSSVRNILLIGNDSRGEDRGRSDSMILLSINSNTNKINLVSLMRDTYVDIPGYGWDKLNAAYSYGGPELLMDTIQENFYIKVEDYISINFTSFASMVDAVGGVEIEVNEDEADAINVLLDSPEGNTLFGSPKESDYLNGAGKYKLNGKQALCYARLRKVGNADFERTERQRKVLTGIMKNIGVTSAFSLIGDALPNMSTNMSKFDMYLLSLRLPWLMAFYNFEQLRIPAEDTYWGSDIDGQSVLEIDFDANLDIVEQQIYAH